MSDTFRGHPSQTLYGISIFLLALLHWTTVGFAQVGLSVEEEQRIKARAAMITAEELYDHEDYEKAIDQWHEALRLDPTLARAHHDLGMALRGKGKLTEAIPELREAVRLDPKNATAWSDLGDTMQEAQDFDGAMNAYQAALALVPKSATVRNNLGYVMVRKGNVDGAIAEWRAAVQIDPKYPAAQVNLAEALESKGDVQGAITAYERFLQLVPTGSDGTEVRKRIERLKSGATSSAAPGGQ